MPRRTDKDLFSESTMTFGEHLEELRKCLWQALKGLFLGFLVGMYFGTDVVVFIQQPVTKALGRYYQGESKAKVHAASPMQSENPEEVKKLDERRDNLFEKNQMIAEEHYLDATELVSQLKQMYPEGLKNLPAPKKLESPENPEGMVRVFLWHMQKDDPRVRTKSLGASETFGIYIKASLLVGVILASPWILYQLWVFVGAGLYAHEKYYVRLYFPLSIILFLLGASLAFFVVFGPVLDFLMRFNHWMGIDPDPRISEWLSFVMLLPLGFGAGFQLPLVMFFLERIGVFTVESYLRQWKLSVLGIVIIAAILTPPDPYSMSFLAGPLVLLFFGGILLCKLVPKRKSEFDSLPS